MRPGWCASPPPRRSARGVAWRPLLRGLGVACALVVGALGYDVASSGRSLDGEVRHLRRMVHSPQYSHVLLVGWDGCLKKDVLKLVEDGKLPNVKSLLDEGQLVDTFISTSKTETKPGWAEILTGYGPKITTVYDNRFEYGPIPVGLTVFERVKQHFGKDGIKTVFLAGKLQNLGIRGPHKVRMGGLRKSWHDESLWTAEEANSPDVVQHAAEPYFYTQKSCDIIKNGLGDAEFVGKAALEALRAIRGNRFFMFTHYWEPDESGHDYGEGTTNYMQSMMVNDQWLGSMIAELKAQGIYEDTLILMTTDHGFDEGHSSHIFAPKTFVITNGTRPMRARGDRKDVTPTVLRAFGIDTSSYTPRLEGSSLLL